jgi:hypothetical protein
VSLGVHLALSGEDLGRVLDAGDADALVELVTEDLEERYLGGEWAYSSDKAWDAIHRCLTDGRLLYESGPFPLAYAVLGGEALDAGNDYTACLASADEVREVSAALAAITEAWMRERYETLGQTDYAGSIGPEDFAYTWSNFEGLRDFLVRAAAAGRWVLFTTDA